jgi:hypothetical protein
MFQMFVEDPARAPGWRWASRWTSASARLTSRPLALAEAGPQIRPRTRRQRQRTLHLTGNIHSITCPPGQCFSVTLQCALRYVATIKGLFLVGLYKVWDREGSTVGSL